MGRIASEEVTIQLIKSKYMHSRLTVWPRSMSSNKI